MGKIYLNSYEPLCISRQGREAAQKYDLPPFVDGSCRREPDLAAAFPAVSALCRGSVFVPKLRVGDTIVYLAKKGTYDQITPVHWRLVAVVEVIQCFDSHEKAAEWYRAQGAELPANCMIAANPPVPWEKTHQRPVLPDGMEANLANWDKKYRERCDAHPEFCACKASFLELQDPPILFEDDMRAVFAEYGRIPVTQNPPVIPTADFDRLLALAWSRQQSVSGRDQ